MISLKIAHSTYTIPTRWDEITLSKAVLFHELCKKLPDPLKQKHDLYSSTKTEEKDFIHWDSELTDSDLKEIYAFYDRVLIFWTGIDQDTLNQTSNDSKTQAYMNYFELFVIGILNNGAGYDSIGMDSFVFHEITYILPPPKMIGEFKEVCSYLTTVQFCEAADLLTFMNDQANGLRLAAYFVAVLCLKEKEQYNEDEMHRRAELFKDLPMNVVWEVVHLFSDFFNYVGNKFVHVFSGKGGKKGVTLTAGWQGFIQDIYIKSNYSLSLQVIRNARVLEWMETKDREANILNIQNSEK
jgi:hypothetical protein